jgi:hypothetical protein
MKVTAKIQCAGARKEAGENALAEDPARDLSISVTS